MGDARRAIVDVYVPGDVIGLDHPGVHTRPLEEIQTLTASTLEAILTKLRVTVSTWYHREPADLERTPFQKSLDGASEKLARVLASFQ